MNMMRHERWRVRAGNNKGKFIEEKSYTFPGAHRGSQWRA